MADESLERLTPQWLMEEVIADYFDGDVPGLVPEELARVLMEAFQQNGFVIVNPEDML